MKLITWISAIVIVATFGVVLNTVASVAHEGAKHETMTDPDVVRAVGDLFHSATDHYCQALEIERLDVSRVEDFREIVITCDEGAGRQQFTISQVAGVTTVHAGRFDP
jgi:hypothetical protein